MSNQLVVFSLMRVILHDTLICVYGHMTDVQMVVMTTLG